MIKNKTIKSYNIRKVFPSKDEINNFIQFSGEKSINIGFNETSRISIFHEDYNIDLSTNTMEIRVKKFEKDNLTPRVFPVYNVQSKEEFKISIDDLMNFYEKLGFEKFNKVYTLEEKLRRQQEKLNVKEN